MEGIRRKMYMRISLHLPNAEIARVCIQTDSAQEILILQNKEKNTEYEEKPDFQPSNSFSKQHFLYLENLKIPRFKIGPYNGAYRSC